MNGLMHKSEMHLVKLKGKNIVLDVETSRVFCVDDLVFDLLEIVDNNHEDEILSRLTLKHQDSDIRVAIDELKTLRLIQDQPYELKSPVIRYNNEYNIVNMDLILSQDCNMRCKYCFAEQGAYKGERTVMSVEVAKKAVDFLFTHSKEAKNVGIVFFGGEPLLNIPVLKETIEYCRSRAGEMKKEVAFSISTNGTLLTHEVIEYLDHNNVHVQISIDGDDETQNKNRPYIGNHGTYNDVSKNALLYMQITKKPLQARMTITSWSANKLFSNISHLFSLGFESVHIEPASGSKGKVFIRTASHLESLKKQLDEMADHFLSCIQEKKYWGYHNLIRYLKVLNVNGKALFSCGAGRGYVCIGVDGDIFPCHRFVGNQKFKMGNVVSDFYEPGVEKYLTEEIGISARDSCKSCWARYLCGGDCYAAAEEINNDIKIPDQAKCELNKHLIDLSLMLYSQIPKAEKAEIEKIFGLPQPKKREENPQPAENTEAPQVQPQIEHYDVSVDRR